MLFQAALKACSACRDNYKFLGKFQPSSPNRLYVTCLNNLNQKAILKRCLKARNQNEYTSGDTLSYSRPHKLTGLRYLSTEESRNEGLYSGPVKSTPGPFKALKIRIIELLVRFSIDPHFDLNTFADAAVKALEVVTHHLAAGEISMLSGLLTQHCLIELEKNVSAMNLEARNNIAVKAKDIFRLRCSDLVVNYDIQRGGKTVDVSMMCAKMHGFSKPDGGNYSSEFFINFVTNANAFDKITMYDFTFTKDYSEDASDEWIISVINIFKVADYIKHGHPRKP